MPSASAGIKGADLEQVVVDVITAGLVERRVDEPGPVILTSKGLAIARST